MLGGRGEAMRAKSINELAAFVGGEVIGDGTARIESGATLELAQPGQITFLANPRYAGLVAATKASAVVLREAMSCPAAQIVVPNPYYAFTRILVLLHGHRQHPRIGISPRASIDPTAQIANGVDVHDHAVVSASARVGRGSVLYPGVWIGPGASVGEDCVLHPNVVVYDGVSIGHRVIVHANATIGQDGLGFSTDAGVHHKIPHLGRVVIEDDVEIGANAGIERGTLADTVICQGSKIGSQVAIGHGVRVGPHCLLVAQTGIAGSTRLGHHCVLAGQAGVAGHLEIGDGVTIAAKSGVHQNIPSGQRVFGYPAFEMEEAVQAYALIKRLPEFRRALKAVEARLDRLGGTRPKARAKRA
jgi:UDP-3-O-[3-hydroxymyristoyl] glucosamine N-acyltransferase